MLSKNVFRDASEQHLIQNRSLARNIDSKNAAPEPSRPGFREEIQLFATGIP
jgi:hypothetical protein